MSSSHSQDWDCQERIRLPRCHFLFNGLGAGNIGDEAMFAGFNTIFDMLPGSTIEVFDERAPILATLPRQLEYITWTDAARTDEAIRAADLVLLVGDTPVSELHGADWPLRAIGVRITRGLELGKSVHGVAIGVDHLSLPEARAVFRDCHAHLSSWTTRSEACRAALLDLGVREDRVAVAADLAWCCPVADNLAVGKEAGGEEDLLGVNIVGEDWAGDDARTRALARALDAVADALNVRIAFVCNETRRHAVYDYDSSLRVAQQMAHRPLLLEPRYVTPQEQIARLRGFRAIISQRYHLGLMGVLAQRPVGLFRRGQKLVQLIEELKAPDLGPHDAIDEQCMVQGVGELMSHAESIVSEQKQAGERLARRAVRNAGFFLRRPS